MPRYSFAVKNNTDNIYPNYYIDTIFLVTAFDRDDLYDSVQYDCVESVRNEFSFEHLYIQSCVCVCAACKKNNNNNGNKSKTKKKVICTMTEDKKKIPTMDRERTCEISPRAAHITMRQLVY